MSKGAYVVYYGGIHTCICKYMWKLKENFYFCILRPFSHKPSTHMQTQTILALQHTPQTACLTSLLLELQARITTI